MSGTMDDNWESKNYFVTNILNNNYIDFNGLTDYDTFHVDICQLFL